MRDIRTPTLRSGPTVRYHQELKMDHIKAWEIKESPAQRVMRLSKTVDYWSRAAIDAIEAGDLVLAYEHLGQATEAEMSLRLITPEETSKMNTPSLRRIQELHQYNQQTLDITTPKGVELERPGQVGCDHHWHGETDALTRRTRVSCTSCGETVSWEHNR